jgi:hypothetical protein
LNRIVKIKAFALLFVLVLGLSTATQPAAAASVSPVFVPGNPSCADLGYDFGFKPQPEPPPTGTYTYPDGLNSAAITSDGTYFDWTSTLGVDAVIVKGGPNANVYVYDPESKGDTVLSSPINSNTGEPFAISHIEFCYDYEVDVSKTANTSFKRTYSWTIAKSADQTALTLSVGQQFLVNYDVTVGATYVDSDWAVNGKITIDNNTPFDATITGVTDAVSGIGNVSVDCGGKVPGVLAKGQTLECTYGTDLPDGTNRINTATVTTSGIVGGGEATADVDFAKATINEVDECIDVSDDKYGSLGTVCAKDAPKTIQYSMYVGPYNACGTYQFINIASFITQDTNVTDSASWTIDVDVPCAGGCTLTQGYWKTHSEYGPAPYDSTWAMLASGADTPFFGTGKTYYQILWTEPKGGNAYLILAHQYIAAELNGLNGASAPSEVQAAMDDAKDLLVEYEAKMDIPKKSDDRAWAIELYELLDDYNNGYIGPGHCSE